ncbi:hypothetical protein V6N11_051629 [Hibiscus sabdariffa]|uniref:Uncharacterized protein n=1 Tax=Hibiscus sabdariffa TaxID=183260 RepID=A0ABR2U7Q0_9ROSI
MLGPVVRPFQPDQVTMWVAWSGSGTALPNWPGDPFGSGPSHRRCYCPHHDRNTKAIGLVSPNIGSESQDSRPIYAKRGWTMVSDGWLGMVTMWGVKWNGESMKVCTEGKD